MVVLSWPLIYEGDVMKNFFLKKTTIAVCFFVLGVLSTVSSNALFSHSTNKEEINSEIENQKVLDPFEEMRKQMLSQFSNAANVQDHSQEIRSREDDKYYYYDIMVKGLDQEKLKINVQDGQIEISGQIENKESENGSSSYFSSSFHRSFPLPFNADGGKVEVENDKEKMTIKVPKKTV